MERPFAGDTTGHSAIFRHEALILPVANFPANGITRHLWHLAAALTFVGVLVAAPQDSVEELRQPTDSMVQQMYSTLEQEVEKEKAVIANYPPASPPSTIILWSSDKHRHDAYKQSAALKEHIVNLMTMILQKTHDKKSLQKFSNEKHLDLPFNEVNPALNTPPPPAQKNPTENPSKGPISYIGLLASLLLAMIVSRPSKEEENSVPQMAPVHIEAAALQLLQDSHRVAIQQTSPLAAMQAILRRLQKRDLAWDTADLEKSMRIRPGTIQQLLDPKTTRINPRLNQKLLEFAGKRIVEIDQQFGRSIGLPKILPFPLPMKAIRSFNSPSPRPLAEFIKAVSQALKNHDVPMLAPIPEKPYALTPNGQESLIHPNVISAEGILQPAIMVILNGVGQRLDQRVKPEDLAGAYLDFWTRDPLLIAYLKMAHRGSFEQVTEPANEAYTIDHAVAFLFSNTFIQLVLHGINEEAAKRLYKAQLKAQETGEVISTFDRALAMMLSVSENTNPKARPNFSNRRILNSAVSKVMTLGAAA